MSTSVRSSQVLDLIAALEAGWPVQSWVIDGVRIWPLVRVRLYTAALNAGLAAEPVDSFATRVLRRGVNAIEVRARVALARLADRAREARLTPPVDVLFLSDGVSFVSVEGKWFEKFYDPIIDVLAARGRSFLMLTPLDRLQRPRRSPSLWIQPRLDTAKALAGRVGVDSASVELPGHGELMQYIATQGFSAALLSVDDIVLLWRRLRSEERVFARVLARARPSRAFVNTYYSIEGMAFVLACRRARVPVADVQHGYQGEHHVAYGRWSRVPTQGYELLPDEFWVWSERERACVDSWRPAGRHEPRVTGNMWLDWWRRGEADAVRRTLRKVELSLVRQGHRHVLVSLPWGIAASETTLILEAAAQAPRNLRWWIRVHPLLANARGWVKREATRIGLENVDVDPPTDFPLHALLQFADVHVTHSSTTVLEASEFGLRSVITSAYGAEFFAAEIAAERAVLATTPEAIASAVDRAPPRRPVVSTTSAASPLKDLFSAETVA